MNEGLKTNGGIHNDNRLESSLVTPRLAPVSRRDQDFGAYLMGLCS